MGFGKSFKQIRSARGYSQNELASGIVSRTSISQIENDKQNPTYDTAQLLLSRLGVSADEFEYIKNGYQRSQLDQIIYEFEHISDSSERDNLQRLLDKAVTLNQSEHNQALENVITVLSVLTRIDDVATPRELREQVAPIWQVLERVDEWTTLDLYIINNILYFFDAETAKTIAEFALKVVDEKFPHLLPLKNAFLLNSALLADDELETNYISACLKRSMVISKQIHRYDLLILARIRLAKITNNSGEISKCLELLKEIGATEILDAVEREFKTN